MLTDPSAPHAHINAAEFTCPGFPRPLIQADIDALYKRAVDAEDHLRREVASSRASVVAFLNAEAVRFDEASEKFRAAGAMTAESAGRCRTCAGLCRTLAAQIARGDDRYYAGIVANTVLGGGYSARLNQEIRVKRGLAYGAGSGLSARRVVGGFSASTQTKNESAAEVIGLIRGDNRRLVQTLDHLVENALRQTPPGGVVTLSAMRSAGEVRLAVSDTGRGVPFHVQAHIFDRFVGRDRGGPGLGLALVKALVELHGGWVALESEPGHGSTFTCHLPEAAHVETGQKELGF